MVIGHNMVTETFDTTNSGRKYGSDLFWNRVCLITDQRVDCHYIGIWGYDGKMQYWLKGIMSRGNDGSMNSNWYRVFGAKV